MKNKEKTNVMRVLDAKKITYDSHSYEADPSLSGEQIAGILGETTACVFKTLVTRGASKKTYVFVIPVAEELDLKKAAKAAGSKSIDLIPLKSLLPLTGYVHGGCSPIGLKKPFPVFIDETAQLFDTIFISAGKRGCQVELSPLDLASYCKASFVALTTEGAKPI